MSYKTKVRVVIIVLVFVFSDLFLFISNQQTQTIQSYEVRIAEYIKQETLYKESLKDIVSSLYQAEVYGGQEGNAVDIAEAYDAVMNTMTDFNELLADVENYFEKRDEYLTTIPCVWPVKRDSTVRVTSGFGLRISPINGEVLFHGGIDITARDLQVPILAAADGTIVAHWPAPDGYWKGHDTFGGMIKIQHTADFETLYGHLSRTLMIPEGSKVKQGQVIGYMGKTGKAEGRHLHYEIHKGGEPQNPIDYLRSNL